MSRELKARICLEDSRAKREARVAESSRRCTEVETGSETYPGPYAFASHWKILGFF